VRTYTAANGTFTAGPSFVPFSGRRRPPGWWPPT
jgi:hypothetical protein